MTEKQGGFFFLLRESHGHAGHAVFVDRVGTKAGRQLADIVPNGVMSSEATVSLGLAQVPLGLS